MGFNSVKNNRKAIGAMMFAGFAAAPCAAQPQYNIVDIGVINAGDFGSQGFGVSPGGVAVGRSLGVSNMGFSWTQAGGRVDLPNFASRPFAGANDANDSGIVVGTGTTTAFGAGALPLMWDNGVVSQLPLPSGEQVGRANAVNSAGVAVGSVGSSTTEFGVIYSGGSATVITQTGPGGTRMRTAFGVNDSGLVVGVGFDPGNNARNVGFAYDSVTNTAFEVGLLPGRNGAIAFGVSNGGHVVGSSSMNQGSGTPFIWHQSTGDVEIPLPTGASSGSARGVNSNGWAVGIGSGVFAVPFLFDGTQTYNLQDLIPAGSGWDLGMNTSSSAMGITEDGMIIGTGVFNGEVRAYAMILIPSPGVGAMGIAMGLFASRRRRR